MDGVVKTYFDPLATTKAQIRALLRSLPEGSAHPYSPEKLLFCRTSTGIKEISISDYDESFFYNAVDLGELGEVLLDRIQSFSYQLHVFDDFSIQQVPPGTFQIPITTNAIAIIAVSQRHPTYYDLCLANKQRETCCFSSQAQNTFPGVQHSGDHNSGSNFLAFVTLDETEMTDQELCVFISGYSYTQITKFLGTHPALLLADHVKKILYMIPVPLDAATIGDATLCCPLVVQKQGTNLSCCVLATATTDSALSCTGTSLQTPCFERAINAASLTSGPQQRVVGQANPSMETSTAGEAAPDETSSIILNKKAALAATYAVRLPQSVHAETTQIIRFGKGIEFVEPANIHKKSKRSTELILPCIWGSQLSGPLLLCTARTPVNVPFTNANSLLEYYNNLDSLVFVVDDSMTDNARNLAPSLRFNAVFVVQPSKLELPDQHENVTELINNININAVTALAGPLSLILIQLGDHFYFYRGLANPKHLNPLDMAYGDDLSAHVASIGLGSLVLPSAKRVVNIEGVREVLMQSSGQSVSVDRLDKIFADLPIDSLQSLKGDITALVPQLQVLLNQTELQSLSNRLIATLSTKVNNVISPLRAEYIDFVRAGLQSTDPAFVKKKAKMLGDLRRLTKETQSLLSPIIASLSTIMSAQTTSKRSYDLKRLVRSSKIQANVEAAKSVTFETLAGYLETYATECGTLLLNVDSNPFQTVLNNLDGFELNADQCCSLESRLLYLSGLDAGILLEQSQSEHHGPLSSTAGPAQPILALTNLVQSSPTKSMLAWVCWDEFVELETPFGVRWIDKCNEPHIAALRIIMRSTLSQAVASRLHNLQPSSPQIGHLMTALLMAAMSKLAASKSDEPQVSKAADDTVIKLMRGLYGNLLTIAGSGVKPMSMVWQLFGQDSQPDVPSSTVDWIWYETAVALYPYTAWPRETFHLNLQKLMDKAIIRLVSKGENISDIKKQKIQQTLEFCRLRNIQLENSRTIITILMRMLTEGGVNVSSVARRLLEHLPHKLKRQSQSYPRMIRYLEHLSKGGERRSIDDGVAANVYTRRSGVFTDLKSAVAKACEDKDWPRVIQICRAILDAHDATAQLWQIDAETLTLQNADVYHDLQKLAFDEGADEDTKKYQAKLVGRIVGDAEIRRVPWQIGKAGQYGPEIEPLDEGLVQSILTGEEETAIKTPGPAAVQSVASAGEATSTVVRAPQTVSEQISAFASTLNPDFVAAMKKDLKASDVCALLGMPKSTLRVFAKALNPAYGGEDIGSRFKAVILELLRDRSDRTSSRPSRTLFALDEKIAIMAE